MFGAPIETRAEVIDTVRMIWMIKPDRLSTSFFTPTPGSGMAEKIDTQGMVIVDPYRGPAEHPTRPR